MSMINRIFSRSPFAPLRDCAESPSRSYPSAIQCKDRLSACRIASIQRAVQERDRVVAPSLPYKARANCIFDGVPIDARSMDAGRERKDRY